MVHCHELASRSLCVPELCFTSQARTKKGLLKKERMNYVWFISQTAIIQSLLIYTHKHACSKKTKVPVISFSHIQSRKSALCLILDFYSDIIFFPVSYFSVFLHRPQKVAWLFQSSIHFSDLATQSARNSPLLWRFYFVSGYEGFITKETTSGTFIFITDVLLTNISNRNKTAEEVLVFR